MGSRAWRAHEISLDPTFDFNRLFFASCERNDWDDSHYDPLGLFSMSPLTSLDSSPRGSADSSPLTSPPSSRQPTPPPSPALPFAPLPPVLASAPATREPISRKAARKQRKKESGHQRARQGRGEQRRVELRPGIHEKHVTGAETVKTRSNLKDSQVTRTAYTARDHTSASSTTVYSLADLVGKRSEFGFRRVPWDGSSSTRVVDRHRRLVAILAGRPNDGQWFDKMHDAVQVMDRLRPGAHVPKVRGSKKPNRRGPFIALPSGNSYGGGQVRPKQLEQHASNKKIVDILHDHPFFYSAAGFASSVLKYWAPRLFQRYESMMQALKDHFPDFDYNYSNSVFAATSYNLGPATVCYKHRDFANIPFGLCAVTSLGSFDPRKGGHMVLWECGLVVDFPPGSTILLPSAVISHSNTNISPGETRYSVAQYSAGGLFRYVDNGFQTSEALREGLSQEEKRQLDLRDAERWVRGLRDLPIFSA